MYRLRYGISGLDKLINENQYRSLPSGEKMFYEKAKINQCAAHDRDSIFNIEKEINENKNKEIK